MEYSIGEFSKITHLSIKTLRFYHEEGLLLPARIEKINGYRFYSENSWVRARAIIELKELGFNLAEIKTILAQCQQDQDVTKYLIAKTKELHLQVAQNLQLIQRLETLTMPASSSQMPKLQNPRQAVVKEIPDQWVVSIRFQGAYAEVGRKFAELFKTHGRYATGKSFSLYYDQEYREDDADIESCLPIRKPPTGSRITGHLLSGGKAITLIHQGPYATLSTAYKIVMDEVKNRGLKIQTPLREVYLKGPGMILPGNPKKYLTEIQWLITEK